MCESLIRLNALFTGNKALFDIPGRVSSAIIPVLLLAGISLILGCAAASDSEGGSRDYQKCEYNGEVFEEMPRLTARLWVDSKSSEHSATNLKIVHSREKVYDPFRDKDVHFCLIAKADWPEVASIESTSSHTTIKAETPRDQVISVFEYDIDHWLLNGAWSP